VWDSSERYIACRSTKIRVHSSVREVAPKI
jgi:hypothetical protein